MGREQIDAARDDGKVARILSRLAVIVLIAAASVLAVTTNAFASGTLSSTVLSETEPGLALAPPGPYNGPLTSSNLAQVTGSSGQGEADLAQLVTSGALTAYIRAWGHQPADGDAVVITAFQFAQAPDENAFVTSLDSATRRRAGAVAFAVPGIPGAIGAATHIAASGTTLAEYSVFFEKGKLVFQLEVASSSGDLTSADAVTLANEQFAKAPNAPARPGGTNLNGLRVVLFAVGLPLTVAVFVIGRIRRYPPALTGFASHVGTIGMPPAFVPAGPWGASAPRAEGFAAQEPPKVGTGQWQ